MLLLGLPDQVRHGLAARRQQHAAVHGDRRRRLQAVVRLRCPALHLRRFRRVRRAGVRRLEPVRRPSDPVGARAAQSRIARDHRHRSAPHRNGAGRHAPPAARAEVGPDAVLWPGHAASSSAAGSTTRSSPRTPAAFDEFREFVAAFPAGARRCSKRACRRAEIEWLARTIHDGQARLVLVDDGRQPELSRGPHRPEHHQPGPDDRQHRPARDRAPTRSPASATRWARGCSATRPTWSAGAISPMPSIAAKSPTSSASTQPAIPDRNSLAYDQILDGVRDGKIRGLWIIATNTAHSWINQNETRELLAQARFPGRAGHVPHDRNRPARPSGPAGRRLGREGRHVHQFRAADRPGEESGPRAGPGPGRFRHLQAGRPLLGLRRDVRRLDRAPKPSSRS